MKVNPDLAFVREPDVNPEVIAALGSEGSWSQRQLPPDRLWCIIYTAKGDSQTCHKDFVYDSDMLKMKIGQMTSDYKFRSSVEEGTRQFVSAWQLIEGQWVQLDVKLELHLKPIDKYVSDNEEEE